ncbi:hypothetical protein [Lactiplantibacillus fabifermentans]|nr:hypothetical protein [Lactiplantibacillus fabifermentans]ETY74190.1 hypothetical protein LFAB_08370 [Lactiplantibacillus fabifermentans T30PCM01]
MRQYRIMLRFVGSMIALYVGFEYLLNIAVDSLAVNFQPGNEWPAGLMALLLLVELVNLWLDFPTFNKITNGVAAVSVVVSITLAVRIYPTDLLTVVGICVLALIIWWLNFKYKA